MAPLQPSTSTRKALRLGSRTGPKVTFAASSRFVCTDLFLVFLWLIVSTFAQEQFHISFNGVACPMILDDDVQVTPGYWNYASVNCTTPNVVAGLYNVTMNTDDKSTNQYGLGNALEKTQARIAKGGMCF
jgi:hypothetical protein